MSDTSPRKRARVLAALRGAPVDRVPVGFWGHHYLAENDPVALAAETLRQLKRFDWDFLKPQSRAQCFAEMWGLLYEPSGSAGEKYRATRVPVTDADGFRRLRPVDPTTGALGEQIEALRRVRAGAPDVPIVWTVFAPVMVAAYLVPGGAPMMLQIARSDPEGFETGLAAISETLAAYARACVEAGADGLFYATNLANAGHLSPEETARFQWPFDRPVLESASGSPFNVLHLCGAETSFDAFADYPVAAFSWAAGERGNPTLLEGHQRTGKAVMGGLPAGAALRDLSPEDAAQHARRAITEMDGRWLLLAPDCSIDLSTPDEVLLAVRNAALAAGQT